MPNRDSETSCNSVKPADAPSCYLAPCGIVRCASEAIEEAQHLPSGRLTIFPSSWSRRRRPANWFGKAGFQAGQECSATHVFGQIPSRMCSVFRSSAGARLCRIAEVRKSSGCCHGAVIRHIPEFGIAPQVMGCDVLQARSPAAGPDHVPHDILRDASAPHLSRPCHAAEDPSLRDPGR